MKFKVWRADRLFMSARLGRVVLSMGLLFAGFTLAESEETPTDDSGSGAQEESELTLTALLATSPTSREYRETQECVNKSRVRDYEVLNSRLVVMTMRGKDKPKLLIQFKRQCHGLAPKTVLNLESRGGSRLCAGDWLRTEVFEFGQRSWGPRCHIPGFEPISDHQLTLLREALVNGRVK